MPIADKDDEEIIRLVREEAEKFNAKINKINLDKQILDIECPDDKKDECAVAIQKILAKHCSTYSSD